MPAGSVEKARAAFIAHGTRQQMSFDTTGVQCSCADDGDMCVRM
jgi:hypothetical protein